MIHKSMRVRKTGINLRFEISFAEVLAVVSRKVDQRKSCRMKIREVGIYSLQFEIWRVRSAHR